MLPIRHGPLILRRFRPADAAAFHAIRSDPEVGRFQDWDKPDYDGALAFVSAMETAPSFPPGGWWQIAIAWPRDDQLAGDMGLHLSEDGSELELGITLAREAQGQGLAPRAIQAAAEMVFAETSARRIVMITDARNRAMLAVLDRLGLSQVDVLHDQGFPEPVFQLPRPA
ncbi:MAG: GNAT family N-acetyltransferase [Pseudomonadota bacterium]